MIKIALGMIVKGSKEEAIALERCLRNVLPHVDKAFITVTHGKGQEENEIVKKVCNDLNIPKYEEVKDKKGKIKKIPVNENLWNKIVISDFEWIKDFSAARNFNFSQISKEYTHILWCDADDVFRGLERLRNILTKHKDSDIFGMWYLYHFDEYKQADVVHKKTMILRNDDCAIWKGRLHEDLIENRQLQFTMVDKYFNGGIDRMHLTSHERDMGKNLRNVEISKEALNDDDKEPRNYLNYGQSLNGCGKYEEAIDIFLKFIKVSGSEEEKFIANLRLSDAYASTGNREKALEHGYIALGMRPQYPDGYFTLGNLLYRYQRLDESELYFLMGLKMKPQYNTIIFYNPRDYDYNPMRMLIRIYTDKGRPDLGVGLMKACLEIYPNNNELKEEFEFLKKETERLTKIVSNFDRYKKMTDEEFKKEVDSLPEDIRSHPGVTSLYNQRFFKTKSNGRELHIYCYPTAFDFNPELFEKVGFGGSEEAVINLSKELAELGWEVTVFNRCGPVPKKYGKVWFKPFWMWNYRDVVDVLILWRAPKPLDFELGAKKVFMDVHDVVPHEEFTPERLKRVTKIMVKTKAHRKLYPNVPDNKIAVVPNGQDNSLFKGKVKKDPYLLINTSSPDRSMDVLPELFKRVKERVPKAKLKWAYGWLNFDNAFHSDPLRMKWKDEVEKNIKDAGIISLGKLPQKDVAALYEEGTIMAYPSEFFEIDCISVKKAQAAGCIPVTTDFAAFDESVQFGVKIHSKKDQTNWSLPYQYGFGITDEDMKQKWVDETVKILEKGVSPKTMNDMKKWAREWFTWGRIANLWNEIIK